MPLLACDGKSEPLALLIPAHRQIVSLEHRDAAKLGRLPPVEDRGDDAGSERRQPQEPRQMLARVAALGGELVERRRRRGDQPFVRDPRFGHQIDQPGIAVGGRVGSADDQPYVGAAADLRDRCGGRRGGGVKRMVCGNQRGPAQRERDAVLANLDPRDQCADRVAALGWITVANGRCQPPRGAADARIVAGVELWRVLSV